MHFDSLTIRAHRLALVAPLLVASLALSGCGKLKKPGADDDTTDKKSDKKADEAATTSKPAGKKKSAGESPEKSEAPVKTVGPSADGKETEGCKLPENGIVKTDWRLETGCSIDVPNSLVIDDGAAFTVEPGVKLKFGAGAYLEVRNGKLIAKGTEDSPIVFTSKSKSPGPGDWSGLFFNNKATSGNILDHVTIEYAGKKFYAGQSALLYSGDAKHLAVTNTTFQHCEGDVVSVRENDGIFVKFEHNTFKDNDGNAMHIPANVMGSVGEGNLFGTPIHLFQQVSKSATWPKIDTYYVMEGPIKLASAGDRVILTLPTGGTLKFNADSYFDIGGDAGGGLIAKNVTFTSASTSPSPADWIGIVLFGKASTITLDGCTFEFAGKKSIWGTGVIHFHEGKIEDYPGFKMTHTTFTKCVGPAMRTEKADCGEFDEPASENKFEGGKLCGKEGA